MKNTFNLFQNWRKFIETCVWRSVDKDYNSVKLMDFYYEKLTYTVTVPTQHIPSEFLS